MFGLLFLTVGILFFWLIAKDFPARQILARGWGISTRIYSRDDEPIRYWVTFWSYLICPVCSIVCAVLVFRSPV